MFITTRRRGGLGRWRGRGMGTVATQVGNSLVYSSDPVARARSSAPVRAIGPARAPTSTATNGTSVGPVPVRTPVWGGGSGIAPAWGSGGPQTWQGRQTSSTWSAANSPYGSTAQNPTNSQALAAAQALLATNPSLLSQQQFQMLQAAGLVSNTLPYSSVSQITPTTPLTSSTAAVNDPNCVAAGCTGGPYPNCTCAAAAATSSFDLGTALSTTYAGLPLYLWLAGGLGVYLLMGHKSGRR